MPVPRIDLPPQKRFALLLTPDRKGLQATMVSPAGLAAFDRAGLRAYVNQRVGAAYALAYELQRYVARPEETGWLPRRLGLDLLDDSLRGLDPETVLVVLVTDIQNLREINQRFRFPVGDEVIARCDRLLARGFGAKRVWVIRTGGDERLTVLYGITLDEERRMAAGFHALERGLARFLRSHQRDAEPLPAVGMRFVHMRTTLQLLPAARATAERLLGQVRHQEKAAAGIDETVVAAPPFPTTVQAHEIVRDAVIAIMQGVPPDAPPFQQGLWGQGEPDARIADDPVALVAWTWDLLGLGAGDQVPADLVERAWGQEAAAALRAEGAAEYRWSHDALADLHLTTWYLVYQATVDDLTGAWRRELGVARMMQTAAALQDAGRSSALVMLELANLTTVNNKYLHEAGDLYIQCWAAASLETFGQPFVRVGGPRAAILVPDGDEAGVARQIQQVRERLTAEVEARFRVRFGPEADAALHEVVGLAGISAGVSNIRGNKQWWPCLHECMFRLYANTFFPRTFDEFGRTPAQLEGGTGGNFRPGKSL